MAFTLFLRVDRRGVTAPISALNAWFRTVPLD
jgi:hypothetical protein